MKKIIIACLCVVGLFSNAQSSGAATVSNGDAIITAGEAIDLNWDSKNVTGRNRTNDYVDALWSGAAPATDEYGNISAGWTANTLGYSRGTINYLVNHFTKPGMYTFNYFITDDDAPYANWHDWAYLTVLPLPPVSLNAVSCNGTNAELGWNPAPDTTGGRVVVYKPVAVTCPAGWNVASGGFACQKVVNGGGVRSVDFPFTGGTAYTSWEVYSRAGALESIDRTDAAGFTCSNPPTVDLNLKSEQGQSQR
jgi:hypothetical protein